MHHYVLSDRCEHKKSEERETCDGIADVGPCIMPRQDLEYTWVDNKRGTTPSCFILHGEIARLHGEGESALWTVSPDAHAML